MRHTSLQIQHILRESSAPVPERFVWFERLAPRGGIIRYGLVGCFNTLIFALFIAILTLIFGVERQDSNLWTLIWGISWFISGVLAHWIHRKFTFKPSTKLTYSVSTGAPVYVIALFGSSATFGLLVEFTKLWVPLLGLANVALWGLFQWALNRTLIFRHDRAVRWEKEQE